MTNRHTAESIILSCVLLTGCGTATAGDDRSAMPPTSSAEAVLEAPAEPPLGPFVVRAEQALLEPVRGPEPEADGPTHCLSLRMTGLTFVSNDVEPTPGGRSIIEQLVATLKTTPTTEICQIGCSANNLDITVDGHTDDLPTTRPGGNEQLSADRAEAIATMLTNAGFMVSSWSGHAATRPPDEPEGGWDDVDQARAAARRVEIHLWCLE